MAPRRAFPKFSAPLSEVVQSKKFDIFFCACISHSRFQTWRRFSFFDTKRVPYSSTEIFKIEASPKVMPVLELVENDPKSSMEADPQACTWVP